jgi:formate/nitrite transporter FocA (FNT family)
VGKYLSLFLGVIVFILCGFEHCIANMFYISMAGMWSGKAFVFLLVNTLGNAVGGWIIPVAKKAMDKIQ